MGNRKIRGSILSFLSLAIIGLLFQNCSPAKFQVSENFQIGNSDNGYSYGGKPSGNYFRFTPGFSCENRESPVASVNIFDSQISLVENRKLQCGAVNIQLDPALIDSSIYQRDVIGYKEGIFEGQSEIPTKIPANLVELWCRDRNDEQGIETITHFDRENNRAVNRTFYSTLNSDGTYFSNEIPDFSVSRLIMQRKVIVKDGQNFELIVDRDKLATEPGLFMGTLKAVIEGKSENRVVKCRLGGALDAKVWPVKQIVDITASFSLTKTAPDLSRFAFPMPMGKIFISTMDGSDQKFVEAKGSNPLYSNIWNFRFTEDSKNLIFTGHALYQSFMELFRIDLAGSTRSPVRLNEAYTLPAEASRGNVDFKISADNKHIIYSGASSGPQAWIRTVPIAGGPPKVLNPENREKVVSSFHISKANNKVLFGFGLGDNPYDLYSVDPDGENSTLISTHLPQGYNLWGFNDLIDSPGFVFVNDYRAANGQSVEPKNFAIALDGSRSIELGDFGDHYGVSPSGRFIFTTPANTSKIRVTDLIEGSFFLSDILMEPTFSQDSTAIFGRKTLAGGRIEAVSVSPSDGTSGNLCPSMGQAVPLGIAEVTQNDFVIVGFDEKSKILRVYLRKSGLDCHLVNSIPLDFMDILSAPQLSIKGIRISQDKHKITVNLGIQETFYYNRLFYLPLDGQPPMQVNAPALRETQISDAYILNDSKTVVFYGNQFNSDAGWDQVYLWKAP